MIPESMPFAEFKKHFSETEQHYFPVMDQQGKLSRIFSVNDIRGVLFAPGIGQLIVMKDIGTSQIITASPSEDLNSVLKKFTVKNIDSLPVVRDEDPPGADRHAEPQGSHSVLQPAGSGHEGDSMI